MSEPLSDVNGYGLASARPAAGVDGRLYYASDTSTLYRDNGSTWDTLTPGGGGMTNPMSAQDDIIVGGASGAPARLAKGSDGQVLTVDPTTHHLLWATPAAATDASLSTSDTTTNNVSSTKHGFAPKSPADATQFLNGAATPAFAAVKDSDLSTTDVTSNNASTSKHGFAPKYPNDATKFLDGTGAYSVPSGSGVDNWLVEVMMLLGSHGNTNWTTFNVDAGELYGGDLESSGAQNDEIYWDLGLSGGTWDFSLLHFKGPNRGIYTVSIDGSSIGTIDGYNASGLRNNIGSITGVSITAGKRRLKLKMATKNGSSSSYFGTAQAWQLRRTA